MCLAFFEFVHNARKRGTAIFETLAKTLLKSSTRNRGYAKIDTTSVGDLALLSTIVLFIALLAMFLFRWDRWQAINGVGGVAFVTERIDLHEW